MLNLASTFSFTVCLELEVSLLYWIGNHLIEHSHGTFIAQVVVQAKIVSDMKPNVLFNRVPNCQNPVIDLLNCPTESKVKVVPWNII
jgi:hypothetical protein